MGRLLGWLLLVSVIGLGLRGRGWITAVTTNAALTLINQGLVANEVDILSRGQTLLGAQLTAVPEYHRSLIGARLDPDNLVVNGGFEFNAHGWQIGGSSFISRTLPLAGVQAAVVVFDHQDISYHHFYQKVAVVPEQCYLLQAWLQIEGDVDRVALEVWDGPRGYRHWYGGRTPLVSGPLSWTQTELAFCAPADVDEIQIRLRRYGGQGRQAHGAVWLDEVRLGPLHLWRTAP